MGVLPVAAYKKSPKSLGFRLFFSTKAGFCLFPRFKKPGLRLGKHRFLKSPEDGLRSPPSRRLVYPPTKDALSFICAFMSRRISVIPRLSVFLSLSCGILRGALCFFGIEAPFIRRKRLKNSSVPAGGFMLITFPDTPLSLILMSSSG